MKKEKDKLQLSSRSGRREFFKTTALLGGVAIATTAGAKIASASFGRKKVDYTLNNSENIIYSVCLQCHTDCPIKVKLQDGVAVKIDGNPYSIQTLNPEIPFSTNIDTASKIDSGICPKGQAGIQSLYDPYRLTKVLKRAGKRGENRWKVISFDQAVGEIVEGGKLFANIPGEENRTVGGLKDIRKLKDAKLSKQMAKDAMNVGKGKLSLPNFKIKYSKYLDLLIDPDHPDLGPVNNKFVFMAGRIEHGRKELAKRFHKNAFGSNNWFEHTTVCEQSHHIAYHQVTSQYKNGKWKVGPGHMVPDLYNSEFVIFFGTGAFEANFGPPIMANLVTNNIIKGQLKLAVVDPRFSKTAAKAWKWVPIKPGKDAFLIYGMIRWMIENGKYDKRYLTNSNKAAAIKDNETTWSNATALVKIEKDGPGKLLRASEIGIGSKDQFVAIKDGKTIPFFPNDLANEVEGDLFFSGQINGIKLKTAFELLKDYAFGKSLKEWADEAGIATSDIVELTTEFVKHGKKSVADMYRGVVQHTSGYYNGQAVITLDILMGNADWKGGLSKGGGGWHEDGSKPGQPFNLKKGLFPNKLSSFGHKLTREGSNYEDSTLFREYGYPAKRPWFPHTGNVYQEIIPSAQDGYPYNIKALLTIKGTPVLSVPAGNRSINILTDLNSVPLHISCDIVIGETSMYADYIFPDCAIWERWGTPHTTPMSPVKHSKVRQPTIEPLTEKVTVFGETGHAGLETLLMSIAEKMNLPGFGKDGFGKGMDFTGVEDYYLKLAANMAAGDKPGNRVADADSKELNIFTQARRHLSSATFDTQKWQKALVDSRGRSWFKKTVYVLNRGSRGEDFEVYMNSGAKLPHKFGGMFNIYVEPIAATIHSYTGKRFSGTGLAEQTRGFNGKVIEYSALYPLRLITFKEITGGQSRTFASDYWLQAVLPENKIIINRATASQLGFRDGDTVRLVSSTNKKGVYDLKNGTIKPVEGKIETREGMRPGVVCVSWHYGHWAYGSRSVTIDGNVVPGEKARGAGLCPNAVMMPDPTLKNSTLEDLIGGSAVFYDSYINLKHI